MKDKATLATELTALEEIEQKNLYEEYASFGMNLLSFKDLETTYDHGKRVDGRIEVPNGIRQRFHANIERVIKCLNAVGGKAGINERRMSHLQDLPLSGIGSNEMHSICESIEKEYNLPETPGASESETT